MPRKKHRNYQGKPLKQAENKQLITSSSIPTPGTNQHFKKQIFYWDGIIAEPAIISRFAKSFGQIMRNELKSANFELKQSSCHSFYTIKINDTHRALFTTERIGGKQCLILLEIILEHKYNHSRFLNNPRLRARHIAGIKEAISVDLTRAEAWVDVDLHGLLKDVFFDADFTKRKDEPVKPIKWNNGRYMEFVLSSSQEDVLQAKTPLTIIGHPGSGKSSILPSIIAQGRMNYQKIICLTASSRLLNTLRALSEDVLLETPEGGAEVEFKTWIDLVSDLYPDLQGLEVVGEKAFCSWYQSYLPEANKRAGFLSKEGQDLPAAPTEKIWKEPTEIYQEMRNASGYSLSEYLALGIFDSEAETPEVRLWIYYTMEAWERYVLSSCSSKNPQVDLSFLPLIPTNKASKNWLWFIDEAQDFSKRVLRILSDCAGANFSTIFCVGPHQNLYDKLSPIPFLNKLAFQANLEMQQVQLLRTYRIPSSGLPLNNRILYLEKLFVGGALHKQELPEIPCILDEASIPGSLHWYSELPDEVLDCIREAANSAQFAIITLPQYVEEARRLFATELIFTADTIKGLEFEGVLIYKLCNTEKFGQINRLLSDRLQKSASSSSASSAASSSSVHLPKNGKSAPQYAQPFNHLFTATSRFSFCGIVVQPDHFLLEKSLPKKKTIDVDLSDLTVYLRAVVPPMDKLTILNSGEGSQPGAWEKRVLELLDLKNEDMARTIYLQKIGTEDEFAALLTSLNPELPVIQIPKKSDKKSLSCSEPSFFDRSNQPKKLEITPRVMKPGSSGNAASSGCNSDIHAYLQVLFSIDKTKNKSANTMFYQLMKQVKTGKEMEKILLKPFNILPLLRLQHLLSQQRHPIAAAGNSLLAWLCRKQHVALFLRLLRSNPVLLKELADILLTFSKKPGCEFDELWIDIRHLFSLELSKVGKDILSLLAKTARLDEVALMDGIDNCLPLDSRKKLQEFLRQEDQVDSFLSFSNDTSSFYLKHWTLNLMQGMGKTINDFLVIWIKYETTSPQPKNTLTRIQKFVPIAAKYLDQKSLIMFRQMIRELEQLTKVTRVDAIRCLEEWLGLKTLNPLSQLALLFSSILSTLKEEEKKLRILNSLEEAVWFNHSIIRHAEASPLRYKVIRSDIECMLRNYEATKSFILDLMDKSGFLDSEILDDPILFLSLIIENFRIFLGDNRSKKNKIISDKEMAIDDFMDVITIAEKSGIKLTFSDTLTHLQFVLTLPEIDLLCSKTALLRALRDKIQYFSDENNPCSSTWRNGDLSSCQIILPLASMPANLSSRGSNSADLAATASSSQSTVLSLPRGSSMPAEPLQADLFSLLFAKSTVNMDSPIYSLLLKRNSTKKIIEQFNLNPQWYTRMTIVQLCMQLCHNSEAGGHSFFAWICQEEYRYELLENMLSKNQFLKTMILKGIECLLQLDSKLLYVDFGYLICLNNSAKGQQILTNLALDCACTYGKLCSALAEHHCGSIVNTSNSL